MKDVGRSAFRFSLGTLFSRVSGMVREMAMAFVLGTSGAAAAFLIAFRFAYLLRRLFGESALVNGFIPHYQSLKAKDEKSAAGFFSDLFATMTLLLIGLIGVVELALFGFLQMMSIQENNAEVLRLIMLSLPGLLFICLFALHSGFLQCHGRFFLTGFAPVAFNVAWIGTLLYYRHQPSSTITTYLAIALDVAFLFQWAILLPATWKKIKDFFSACRFKLFSSEIKTMLGAISLSILGVGAMQINGFIDTLFARAADLEGPAYLAYAMRLEQFPLALFGIAISSALFPSLSKALGDKEERQSEELLKFGVLRTSFLMIPCSIGILLLGAQAINLLFGHGEFNDLSTVKTTICLWSYGIGLLPTALALLFAQAFFARRDFKTPMILSCYAIMFNIAFNSFLIYGLKLGATSVALSTSLAAFLNAAVLYFLYQRHFGFSLKGEWLCFLRILLSSLAGGATALFVSAGMGDRTLFLIAQGQTPSFEHSVLKQALLLGLPAMAFLMAFTACGYLIRCEQTMGFLNFLKPKQGIQKG